MNAEKVTMPYAMVTLKSAVGSNPNSQHVGKQAGKHGGNIRHEALFWGPEATRPDKASTTISATFVAYRV